MLEDIKEFDPGDSDTFDPGSVRKSISQIGTLCDAFDLGRGRRIMQ